MRKKSAYVLPFVAALMMTACSEKEENLLSGDTSEFKFEVNFTGTVSETRVAGSSVIPTTSWANIKQIQFFLYEGGTVKYSAIETVNTGISGMQTYTYTDVPVSASSYTLVAVANADAATNNIASFTSNVAMNWNAFNVRSKAIADLHLGYKSRAAFPTYANPAGNLPFEAPSEIFMASATGINVTSGATTTLPTPLSLTREVSLMRVRLNVDDSDAGVNNSTAVAGGVDWAQNVSVLIYTLPDKMKLEAGNAGGVVATSTKTNIIVADGVFNGEQTGYTNDNFKKWKDIVVFPNNGGRVNNLGSAAGNDTDASVAQKYFIVVSALGKSGHVLADGGTLSADQTIYWSGLIPKSFFPNTIREVNLTLKSGGATTIPVTPTEQGSLEIDVNAPEPWDSNIQDVSLII